MKPNNKNKLIGVSIFAVLFLLGVGYVLSQDNTAPYFINLNSTLTIAEDSNFTYFVHAADAEEDYPLIFSDDSESKLPVFYMTEYNDTAAIINFTPTETDVLDANSNISNYHITIIVKDQHYATTVQDVLVNITNVNDPPNITSYIPADLTPSVEENNSLGFTFNHTSSDPDLIHPGEDYLNNTWLYDGIAVSTNHSWTYFPGFCDAGAHNVTLIVNDSYGLEDRVEWSLIVNNTNRPPTQEKIIKNITWEEETNLTNNITISEYFNDSDREECSGINKDNLTFGYRTLEIKDSINASQDITIVINQTTWNVSFYVKPNWFGIQIVQFYANDSYNITYSNNVTLNVTNINDPPILAQIPSPQYASLNRTYLYNVIANDPDGDTLYYYTNDTNITIDINTGLINFTPNESYLGTHIVNITVNDSLLIDSQIVTFIISNNSPPVLNPIGNQNATEGTRFQLNLTAFDNDGDNLTFASNSTIFNITWYNKSMSTIDFTPTDADVGNYSIKFNVTDIYKEADYEIIIFSVIDINNPPILEPVPNMTVKVGDLFTLDVNATDADLNDVLHYSTNNSIFEINETTGLINFTVEVADVGIYDVNISVNDTQLSDSVVAKFTLWQNNPPVLNPIGNQNATEDIRFELNLSAFDQDGHNLTFSSNTTLFNITWYNKSMSIINFTPTLSQIGNYSINITVSDGYGGLDYEVITLTISTRNDPPEFVNLTNLTAREDNMTIIIITAQDEEGANLTFYDNSTLFNITWYSFTIGTVNITKGIINFTPTQADVGNYSINLTVSDYVNNISQIINLEIINVNDAPQITDYIPNSTNVTIEENSSILFNVTAIDEDGDNITYSWYYDNILITTNETYNHTANFSSAGNHTIKINVSDIYNAYSIMSWNLTINNKNRPPVLNKTIDNITWNQGRNLTNNLSLNEYFYDPDGENLTYNVSGNNNIIVNINQTSSKVSFIVNVSFYGVEYIRFYASDGTNITYSNNITLNVTKNNEPQINMIYPYGNGTNNLTIYGWANASQYPNGTRIYIEENSTITFMHNTTDADGDNLTYQWLLNGTLVNTSKNLTYYFNFTTAGIRNLTIKISDGVDTSYFYWIINISNKNRAPIFGRKTYTSLNDFTGGTLNNTNITSQPGNITLTRINNKYVNGTYTSPIINLEAEYNKINLTYIRWTAYIPNGTNITLYTRTASTSSAIQSASWDGPYESTPAPIESSNNKYIQFRANFTTYNSTITPTLEEVSISYKIPNQELLEDYIYENWIDLDDYFEELDTDDTITYNYSAPSQVNINISEDDNTVRLSFSTNWYGTAVISFSAYDGYTTTYSNNITIHVSNVEDEEVTQTTIVSGGGGGGGISRITKKVKEYKYEELVTPGKVHVLTQNKYKIPIYLSNNIDKTLVGITLSAESDEEGISFKFKEPYIPQLDINEQKVVDLIVEILDIKKDTYSIKIKAKVDSPELEDSTIVKINTIRNVSEKVNSVMDLLKAHPECLELNELVTKAREAIKNKEYTKADKLLEEAVKGCRFIISKKQELERGIEKPSALERKPIILAIVWIGLISISAVGVYLFIKRKKLTKFLKSIKKVIKKIKKK